MELIFMGVTVGDILNPTCIPTRSRGFGYVRGSFGPPVEEGRGGTGHPEWSLKTQYYPERPGFLMTGAVRG